MSPQFSVIVASYNQARFLREAIASIFNQSLQDFEVVIVDDGSTDETKALISELQRKHPGRIEAVFHEGHQNQGIVRTYQLAISRCQRDYVAFLEPDDQWSPRYLETKVDVFRHHREVDVVFSPYRIRQEGQWGKEMSLRQWILHMDLPKDTGFDNFKQLLRKNNIATFSSFTARREALSNLPELHDQRVFFFDWWVLLFLSANRLFYLDTQSHVIWRQHHQSALRQRNFLAQKNELIDFYLKVFQYFQKGIDALSTHRQTHLLREREKLPLFIEFYQSPNITRFWALFRKDPVWAMDSLASYIVNSRKYGF